MQIVCVGACVSLQVENLGERRVWRRRTITSESFPCAACVSVRAREIRFLLVKSENRKKWLAHAFPTTTTLRRSWASELLIGRSGPPKSVETRKRERESLLIKRQSKYYRLYSFPKYKYPAGWLAGWMKRPWSEQSQWEARTIVNLFGADYSATTVIEEISYGASSL